MWSYSNRLLMTGYKGGRGGEGGDGEGGRWGEGAGRRERGMVGLGTVRGER